MSHLKPVEGSQDQLSVHRCIPSCSSTPTMLKVGAVVIGLLLMGAGVSMYFLNVNAIAAYVTGGVGGITILGVIVWSVVDCLRGKSKDKSKDVGVKEFTLDLTEVEGNPKITEQQVTELLRKNPNLQKLRVDIRPHRLEANWNLDFKALDEHFTVNWGQSSGAWYIYDRKECI